MAMRKGDAAQRQLERRLRVSRSGQADAHIVQQSWTQAQCRAIEIGLGGGFLALTVLEVLFGW